ncbi:hypothetical protein A0U92_09080 [Acetobacter aceti]|uniref:Uncharacterized protein n=1 Tax=Acetobacter aceti TaxID=435 RepID=A0A1U9KGG6_ACEAC|nr:hypothetical protein A0U92_09080 [Acetobacter aceti]
MFSPLSFPSWLVRSDRVATPQGGMLSAPEASGTGALNGFTVCMQPLNAPGCQVNRVFQKNRDSIIIPDEGIE